MVVLASSHPKMALFRDLGVGPRVSLCDVHEYVSAETLALPVCRTIDLAKNDSFWPREPRQSPSRISGWRLASHTHLLLTVILGGMLFSIGCPEKPDDRDPGDGNVQPGDYVLDLEVRPSTLVIDRVTSFDLLCVGVTDDGYLATLDDCSFEVVDGEVADLSAAGRVTPVALGEGSVRAIRGNLASPPVPVTVIETGTIDVRVTEYDGDGLAGAEVQVGCPDTLASGTTDADGRVHLQGDWQGPVDLVVGAGSKLTTVLQQVEARNVVAPLRSTSNEYPRARARGTVDFPEEPAVGEMAIAVALTSTPVGPAFTSISDFMPGNRTVDDFGLNVQLPWNLVVKDLVDDFSAPVYEGTSVLSVAGGYFDLGEVLGIAAQVEEYGPGAVFNIVGVYADRLMLGLYGPFEVPYEFPGTSSSVEDIEIALEWPMDREVAVTLLTPPPDFYTIDPPTILAYRQLQDELGWVIAGVGVGNKPYSHPDADPPADDDDDDDDGTWEKPWLAADDEPWETIPVIEASAGHDLGTPFTSYGAMAVYEGLSETGDATLSFTPPMTGSDAVLPPFLPLYEDMAMDQPRGHFSWDGVESADMARSYIYYWEYIAGATEPIDWFKVEVIGPGGPGELTLPDSVMSFTAPFDASGLDNAWVLDAIGLRATGYQALLTDDGLDGLEAFQHMTNRRSVISRQWDVE